MSTHNHDHSHTSDEDSPAQSIAQGVWFLLVAASIVAWIVYDWGIVALVPIVLVWIGLAKICYAVADLPGGFELRDATVRYGGEIAVPRHGVELVEPADPAPDGTARPPRWRQDRTPAEAAAARPTCATASHQFGHIVYPLTGELSGVFCAVCGSQ